MVAMATQKAVERYKDKRTAEWRRRSTYSIWYGMVARCCNENNVAYMDYGGRGILVYEEWLYTPYSKEERTKAEAFRNFLRDIGLRPSQYVSLDRIEANGHYYTDNLRWGTAKIQARNKRKSLYIEDPDNPGKKIPVAELAERLGISYQVLRYKLIVKGEWPGNI